MSTTNTDQHTIRTQLQAIIAQALQMDSAEVDVHADFMEMGANSLALVDTFRAIHAQFGVRPAIRKVVDDYNNIDKLASYILELQTSQPTLDLQKLAKSKRAEWQQEAEREFISLPLTERQQHLYFLARYSEGGMLAHTNRLILQLDGELATDALAQAVETVAQRHEVLRLTMDGEEVEQRIEATAQTSLQLVDFANSPNTRSNVSGWLREEGEKPLQLNSSLWRITLLKLSNSQHLLLLTAHALIADMPALHRLASEIATIYTAHFYGNQPMLGKPASFREYAELSNAQRNTPQWKADKQFWQKQLAGIRPQLDLPSSYTRPPIKQYNSSRLLVHSVMKSLNSYDNGVVCKKPPLMQ